LHFLRRRILGKYFYLLETKSSALDNTGVNVLIAQLKQLITMTALYLLQYSVTSVPCCRRVWAKTSLCTCLLVILQCCSIRSLASKQKSLYWTSMTNTCLWNQLNVDTPIFLDFDDNVSYVLYKQLSARTDCAVAWSFVVDFCWS